MTYKNEKQERAVEIFEFLKSRGWKEVGIEYNDINNLPYIIFGTDPRNGMEYGFITWKDLTHVFEKVCLKSELAG